ncbi:DMT family transporter [Roseovarius tibetensis]|uniref:DMT family transporter n=1 Tax=Roseovarius tibetensis TaxID=2685897 RepID=UPI003D7F7DFA
MSLEFASFLLSIAGVSLAAMALFIQARDSADRKKNLLKPLENGIKPLLLGLSLALVCAVIWAIANVSLKHVSLGGADMFLFVGAMMAFAGALGISAAISVRKSSGFPTLSMNSFEIGLAFLGNFGNAIFFILAIAHISSSELIILGKTNPIFLALFLFYFLGERLTRASFLSVFVVFIGVVLLVSDPQLQEFRPRNSSFVSYAFALLAGISFSVFSFALHLSNRRETDVRILDNLFTLAIVNLLTGISLIVFAFLFIGVSLSVVDSTFVLWTIFNAIRLAFLYLVYKICMKYVGPVLASVLVMLEVPFTMVLEQRWVGLSIDVYLVVGAVLISAGIVSMIIDAPSNLRRDKAADERT